MKDDYRAAYESLHGVTILRYSVHSIRAALCKSFEYRFRKLCDVREQTKNYDAKVTINNGLIYFIYFIYIQSSGLIE